MRLRVLKLSYRTLTWIIGDMSPFDTLEYSAAMYFLGVAENGLTRAKFCSRISSSLSFERLDRTKSGGEYFSPLFSACYLRKIAIENNARMQSMESLKKGIAMFEESTTIREKHMKLFHIALLHSMNMETKEAEDRLGVSINDISELKPVKYHPQNLFASQFAGL